MIWAYPIPVFHFGNRVDAISDVDLGSESLIHAGTSSAGPSSTPAPLYSPGTHYRPSSSPMPSEGSQSYTSHASRMPTSSPHPAPQTSHRGSTQCPRAWRTLGLEDNELQDILVRSLGQLTNMYLKIHGYLGAAQRFVVQTYSRARNADVFVAILGRRGVSDSELRSLYERIHWAAYWTFGNDMSVMYVRRSLMPLLRPGSVELDRG